MRKDLKLEDRPLNECEVTDEGFDDMIETKPRTDDTLLQKVTTEKVVVSRRDIISSEEPQKPTHRKDLDIGRIVIEEIPEEKDEIPEYENIQKKQARPKTADMTAARREVKERHTHMRDDIAEFDSTDSGRTTKEVRRERERVQTQRETRDGRTKVKLEILKFTCTIFFLLVMMLIRFIAKTLYCDKNRNHKCH